MLKMAGILENLDPRSKIISFLAIIISIVMTPITRFKDFGLYFLVILAMIFLSRVTPGQIVKKICLLIPWILFMAMFVPFVKTGCVCWSLQIGCWKLEITDTGAWAFLNIVVKSGLSFLVLIIASLTTTFSGFFRGLALLHVPRLLIMLVYVIYRGLFVFLHKTAQRLQAGYQRFIGVPSSQTLRVPGFMAGLLTCRAPELSEKSYEPVSLQELQEAIRSARDFRISAQDFFFLAGIIVSLLCIVSGLVYQIEYIKRRDVHVWHGVSLF